VVADVRSEGVREATIPELYLPYAQLADMGSSRAYARGGVVVVRTDGQPEALAGRVRDVIRGVDPEVPVTDVRRYDVVAADMRARERFLATVMGVFAVIAVLIAAVGTFGVVTYVAARRTREYGVRAALGAGRSDLVSRVVGGGVRLAALGAVLGAAGAAAGAPLLERFLFGVGTRDPLSFLAGPCVVLAVVLVASALPAGRAARIDPVRALREDA
jgi:predicted lysophospholipase L1 biosynthesis ABC-type transport system permease subunit